MFVEREMTSPATPVGPKDRVGRAWTLLRRGGPRHLPRVPDRMPVGIVPNRDVEIARALEWERRQTRRRGMPAAVRGRLSSPDAVFR